MRVSEGRSWDDGTNADVKHLFVYGGLMRGFDLHHYLAGCAFAGEGSTAGALFSVGRYPGLADGDGRVKGELYAMYDTTALMESLDELEDYDPLHPETSLYVRRLCDVTMRDGSVIHAWVYAYQRDVSGLERIPGGDWRTATCQSPLHDRDCGGQSPSTRS